MQAAPCISTSKLPCSCSAVFHELAQPTQPLHRDCLHLWFGENLTLAALGIGSAYRSSLGTPACLVIQNQAEGFLVKKPVLNFLLMMRNDEKKLFFFAKNFCTVFIFSLFCTPLFLYRTLHNWQQKSLDWFYFSLPPFLLCDRLKSNNKMF